MLFRLPSLISPLRLPNDFVTTTSSNGFSEIAEITSSAHLKQYLSETGSIIAGFKFMNAHALSLLKACRNHLVLVKSIESFDHDCWDLITATLHYETLNQLS